MRLHATPCNERENAACYFDDVDGRKRDAHGAVCFTRGYRHAEPQHAKMMSHDERSVPFMSENVPRLQQSGEAAAAYAARQDAARD